MIQLLLKLILFFILFLNFFVKYMFNVMDEKAPFLHVRETYSGLRNCAASHYFLLCCCAAPTLTSSPHYNTVFIFSKLYRN